MLQLLHIAWIVLQVLAALLLLFPVISWLWYLVSGKQLNTKGTAVNTPDYGIIVTAYQYAGNLPNTIQSLLQLDYSNYIIYVVADNCGDEEIFGEHEKLVILRPPEVFANQLKSHFYAIANFKRPHNIVTIIDSDNLVHPAYLSELNKWFAKGFSAVQGVRKAKNTQTAYAAVDAINELYYLFYDRKILFGIGSSSMLSGSGMAFTTDLYRQCLEGLGSSGAGFDKILQKEILMRKHRIAFAEGAIVYDEKTASAGQLVKQRARWNNTWFRYAKFGFVLLKESVKNFSLNQFLYGFILLRPPLFILLFVCALFLILNIFINPALAIAWVLMLLIFTAGFFIALLSMKADKKIYTAVWHIPKFIWAQVLSLLKVKKANQLSVSTEHSYHKNIEEVKE